MFNRVETNCILEELELLRKVCQIYWAVTGEALDIEDLSCTPTKKSSSVFGDSLLTGSKHHLENKSNIRLIVIDQIDYYLYNTSHGFDKMKAFSNSIGCALSKLSRVYGLPVLITAEAHDPTGYSKYNLSPWMNYPMDTIIVEKTTTKDATETIAKKHIVKSLVQSKIVPVYQIKLEGTIKEYKLRFKMKVMSLEMASNTVSAGEFFTEKTFKNS